MRTAAAVAGVALLIACASTSHPPPGGPKFESDEVRFVAPSGWEVQQPTTGSPGLDQVVAYLANQPLHEDCREVGTEISCGSPLTDGLRAGGMLVVWAGRPCVAQSCTLPSGTLLAVGNRQGVRTPTDAGCEGTAFTERYAYYVTVTPQRVDILLVCARDPSDASRSAFLGFLDAIRWRIP
jgi:hypothetical protein